MPDNSPRPTSRKRPLIAPLIIFSVIAAIIVGGVVVHSAHERRRPPPTPVLLPSLPPPSLANVAAPPPLTRTELVQDVDAAADAYATGAKPSFPKSPLIGRRFAIRIPFGCGGPGAAGPTAQAEVNLDASTSSLRLTARPAIWTSLPLFQDFPDANKIETVEGFWIPRPWATTETCPKPRASQLPATPTPATAQTVGLARVFEKGGSRILMRGDRPYQFVVKLQEGDAAALGHTYRLLLEGRIVGYADGRAIHCWSESPDHRPICLYAVDYDRVAFEDAETGDTLAEWRE